MRRGYLADVLAYLYLRNYVSVLVFKSANLVNSAENGVALSGDKALADTEGIYLRALSDKLADDILVHRVGDYDPTLGKSRIVKHLADLLGKIGNVARVYSYGAVADTERVEHRLECADSVGHAALKNVVGINEQSRVVRIGLAVGLKRLVLGVKKLYPRVRHSAYGRNAVRLVCYRAGGRSAAADIRRSRAEHSCVGPLGTTRAELAYCSSLCRSRDSRRLGGDERLMVYHHKNVGLDELCLNDRRSDYHKRLAGKNYRSLGDSPDVSAELKGAQIFKELLREASSAAKILYIALVKVQILDVLDYLLKSRNYRVAAVVGIVAIENVKVNYLVLHSVCEISVAHSKLVIIAKHRKISLNVLHFSPSFVLVGAQETPPILMSNFINYSITLFTAFVNDRSRFFAALFEIIKYAFHSFSDISVQKSPYFSIHIKISVKHNNSRAAKTAMSRRRTAHKSYSHKKEFFEIFCRICKNKEKLSWQTSRQSRLLSRSRCRLQTKLV